MTTIVLAAGRSRRFGRANKLLARVNGRPLIAVTLAQVLAATRGPVVLVVDHQARALHTALSRHGIRCRRLHIVYAPGLRHDMSRSRARGVAAAPRLSTSLQIHLADVPGIDVRTVAQLHQAIRAGAAAARPGYDACPGHPVRFRLDRVAAPKPDAHRDPQTRLKQLPDSAWARVAGPPACIQDIDRPPMLRRRNRRHWHGRRGG